MASSDHPNRQRKSCQTFSSALASAAAEWLLILLIYLDGFFSYLATKFAHYSNLQIPCLLCSRLDHLIGFEKFGLYKDLICHAHKLEISSLAFCHVHQKLAEAHEVCETCLLSFATEKKSNPKAFRSLVGKFERNLANGGSAHPTLPGAVDAERIDVIFKGEDVAQAPLLKRDRMVDSPRTRYCTCCNELFHRKSHVQRLLQAKSADCGDGFLGQAGHNCLQYRDRTNKIREKHLMSPTTSRIGNRGFDRLSHIGYTQLKLTSDSESEVPFSDEDDGNAPTGVHHPKEYSFPTSLRPEHVRGDGNNTPKTFSDSMMLGKFIHATATPSESSYLVTPEQLHTAECHGVTDSSMSENTITRDLGDLNWNEFGRKDHPATPLSCTPRGMKFLDKTEVRASTQGTGSNSVPAKDKLEVSDSKLGDMEIADAPVACSTTYVESPKDFISTRPELKQIQTTHKLSSSVINHMDPSDAYKLAIGYRMNQPSPRTPSRYHEDFKLFFSHISGGRGLEYLYNDAVPSPRVHGQLDNSKMSDVSNTISHQSLGKKFINERNEPGFEFSDAGLIDEIEGESLTDRLKRQIELDRKFMSLLYKELEEERSASAIAANQALAMITRLQEEKAAMQMEALQYQRLMEEQAEYDQEALQETNDLLTEKEKEIQDLEAEIESYRRQLGEESLFTNVNSVSEEGKDKLADISLARGSEGSKAMEHRDALLSNEEEGRCVILKDSLLDLEDEKLYVSNCLKRLKKRLSATEDSHNSSTPSSPKSDNEGEVSVRRITDLTALENEVLHLSDRLGALETDRNLLEHCINLLRNGNAGVQLIQEVASHLRELRCVGTGKREQIDV